ncbi:MAG: hypothetical protein RIQ81_1034, partial [Pseudomonadota bacterium]
MRSILEISLCALALNFTSTTLAAWHSGGGELIRDGRNPWFIGKATQASYCIKTSEDFPIQDHDRLDQAIRYAIDFWQERIELAEPYRKALLTDGSKIQVGPGTFSRKICDGSEDIAFQFGYLNDLQRRALIDPQNFAAITIRTDYDEVNLRGKGFVFVSTDRGPNAF